MHTKNLAISLIGAALLAGALLVPAAASAHGGWDRDDDRHDRREHVERHRHHHKHKEKYKIVREYRYERPWWRRDAPVVVYRDAPAVIYRGTPAVRLGRDNEIGITYRGGW
jgi:hypothetical protein